RAASPARTPPRDLALVDGASVERYNRQRSAMGQGEQRVIGKTIGRYQIIRELGKGGFATVYQGYDPALERHVAIKVLHPELTRDEAALKRFQREAVAVARLRHANIIVV